jgi:aspartyl/asparaginyl-tRNA synthetase
MKIYEQKMIEPSEFNFMVKKLRRFFDEKGYKETYPQSRLSIMAACEDPATISPFIFAGVKYPLPQTNQMWLERDLLVNSNNLDGVYCLTTSYRDEPNPIEGRHDKIFPMFEFEHKGNFSDLVHTLSSLCIFLGFVENFKEIVYKTYDELCSFYKVDFLEAEHENKMWKDFGNVVVVTKFPERTSPFWNMKQEGKHLLNEENLFNKADFIICGMETFGSAERSSNIDEMRNNFHQISNGEYANLLYESFSKERVEEELEDYLSLPMFKRFGGGMGMTRLLNAFKVLNLFNE